MKYKTLVVAMTIFLIASIAWNVFAAPQSPGLYCLRHDTSPSAQDYNNLVDHVCELERIVHGLQKQATILHAKFGD